MSHDLTFETSISGQTDQGHVIRGTLLTDLVAEADFVATLFLSLTGRQPVVGEKKLLNAILVSAIDHGINPSSGFIPRVIAASGNDIYSSMAGALLALGPRHGGAITACMLVLADVKARGKNIEASVVQLVQEYRQTKKRIPGFGHPEYKDKDPRSVQLFQLAQDAQLDPEFINIAQMLELTLEQETGRKLVLNIDGAIAALLSSMGIDALAGNALFGLARVGGSIAHIVEEMRTNDSVRRLNKDQVRYVLNK